MQFCKEGWIEKKGHVVANWKSRWLELTLSDLNYYENETKSKKKGGIKIDRDTKVFILDPVASHLHRFLVQAAENELEMSCASEQVRNEWVKAVLHVVQSNIVVPFYRDCLSVNIHANPSDVLNSILSDGFISYGSQNKSRVALMNQVQYFWELIPDLKWQIEEILVDGNKVAVRSLATGSPRGDFFGVQGLDGSKSFAISTIDIHTVVDGRIKCVNHLEDWTSAIRQLRSHGAEALPNLNVGVYQSFSMSR
jgi:predicted ester cyclase